VNAGGSASRKLTLVAEGAVSATAFVPWTKAHAIDERRPEEWWLRYAVCVEVNACDVYGSLGWVRDFGWG
jgi:hypothetical protein